MPAQNWVAGAAGGRYAPGATPLSADRFNDMEARIEQALAVVQGGGVVLDGGPTITAGSGSPEGVVTAPVGSLYTRTDGGGVALYVKQTGTGSTGWFALTSTTPDPFPEPEVTGPLAEYGFNEGTGLAAYDLTGAGHTLTVSSSTTSWTASTPKYGAAAGKTQHAGFMGPDLIQTDYTVMLWVRREGTWSAYASVFAVPKQYMFIEASAATSYLPSFNGGATNAVGTTALALNTWTHLACTRDSLGRTQIFVNGVLEGTNTANNWGINFGATQDLGGSGAATTPVVCGTTTNTSNTSQWNGSVDDLRIFDRVLTATEITTYMNTGITAVGGVGGGGGGGSWLSGASGDSSGPSAADGTFATWRGTAVGIGGTWLNETPCYPFTSGFTWANWTGPMDVGVSPFTWNGWAAEASGFNDAFWNTLFTNMNTLRAGKGTTYVRPYYEYNGNWMPWKVLTAADVTNFKTAWNRIAGIARTRFPTVKMCLGTAASFSGGQSVASTWPTATVDALSIDFYNRWPFADTQGEFDSAIATGGGVNSLEPLRQLAFTKGVPVIISEWANTGINPGDGGGGGESTAFITAMRAWFAANAGTGPGQVLGEVYFNLWTQYRLYPTNAQPNTAAQYVTSF